MTQNIDTTDRIIDEIISFSKTLNSVGLYITELEKNYPSEYYSRFYTPLSKVEKHLLEAQGVLERFNDLLRDIWISKVLNTSESEPHQRSTSVVIQFGANAKQQVSWTK